MKKQLHKKSAKQTSQTGVAHQRKGIVLQDNRPSTVMQQKKAAKNTHFSSKTVQKMQNGVIQFVEIDKTLRNIAKYFSNTYEEYGPALIRQVCQEHGLGVRGHASGTGGDGMNDATKQDMQRLLPYLQAAKSASPGPVAAAAASSAGGGSSSGGKKHNEAQQKAAEEKKKEKKAEKDAAKKAEWRAKQRK